MKAKELAELLLENPDLDVEVCCAETVCAYGNEHTQYKTYEDIEVNVLKTITGAIVQIDCL